MFVFSCCFYDLGMRQSEDEKIKVVVSASVKWDGCNIHNGFFSLYLSRGCVLIFDSAVFILFFLIIENKIIFNM